MDAPLSSTEMEALWRLAGLPSSAAPATPPSPKFAGLRPRVQAAMVEMVLREVEQDAEAVVPARADVLVLLTSTHPRLRTLGLRLSAGLPSCW